VRRLERHRDDDAGWVLAAPLRAEHHAVRRAGGNARVVRAGMGRAATLPATSAPVLIAGVAGGLAPEVRPGDVVVADSVTDGSRRIDTPSAPLLAAALRRRGLTVHCGQVRTSDRLATGSRRAPLARTGALAVDMESFALAEAARGPVAVVRSIVDVEGQGVWTPGMIVRGVRGLRVLREAVPALEEWAAATGPREVVRAGPCTSCVGVVCAIETMDHALARYGPPVYALRQTVHNAQAVEALRERGAVFVDEVDEVPAGAVLVFAAPGTRLSAAERGVAVIDATCPLAARDADLLLVAGTANPTDQRRHGTPAHLVDDAGGIDLRWLADARRIAVTAGESAPPSLVDEIIRALSGLGPTTVREGCVTAGDAG
jgi:4-hydroxy-3-methylbut-2-en-1-yl diphosphate reductase